ncbi:Organic cation transporter protein [Frankliniella fusca]|uniref:Organic cation transporter protein n=1 Tax=Frankliniella fusca TaxID=407009 RepID=A0AAE1HR95_9NEOP|nr:Organic cation transporter protein [Frankliniella fusca]
MGRIVSDPKRLATFKIGHPDDDEEDYVADTCFPISSAADDEKADPALGDDSDDQICKAVGSFGRWQLRLTFLLSLVNIPCTWHIFVPTFQAVTPENFWCLRPPAFQDVPPTVWMNISHPFSVDANGLIEYDRCNVWDLDYSILSALSASDLGQAVKFVDDPTAKRPCTKWEYADSQSGDTLIQEWDLVCSRKHLKNVAEMTFLAGVALGGLVSGMISDKFGRKKTLLSALIAQIVVGTVIAFNPWFEVHCILRFCLGFISVGMVFSGFVLCMEVVGGKWRTISGVSYLFPVPLSYIMIAGIAYLVRGWRAIQLAITLPAILLLSFFWIMPESPRWLLSIGRKDLVIPILQDAARINNMVLPASLDKHLQQETSSMSGDDSAGVMDLFRTPNIRKISLLLYVIWFSVYLVYYGLVLNISEFAGNQYVNTVISGLVEVPSIALSILILLKMGRRWPFCLTLLVGGVACLLTLLVPKGDSTEWVSTALAMVAKFSASASNAIMPVFTAELFPTVVRNVGVGASNVPAGIALMLTPYLWSLELFGHWVPMTVIGAVSLLGGLTVLLLPETANVPMPQTIEEGEAMGRKNRSSTQPKQPSASDRVEEPPRNNSVNSTGFAA